MHVEPSEAVIVRRVFEECAAGLPLTRIVKQLNREGVPHAHPHSGGWKASTVHRGVAASGRSRIQ